jgi:hypothetical protein
MNHEPEAKPVYLRDKDVPDPAVLAARMAKNNPNNEPVGHFTGRCAACGSKHLWDDATAYGCEDCGAIYFTADIMPRLIPNGQRH